MTDRLYQPASMLAIKFQLSSHKPQPHKSVSGSERLLEGTPMSPRQIKHERATASCLAALATTYHNQGQWKEAKELEVQEVEERKRMLGEENPYAD